MTKTKIEDIAIQFCKIGYKSCSECLGYQQGFRNCEPFCEAQKLIDKDVEQKTKKG